MIMDKDKEKIFVSEEEKELIEAIRNYKKTYPNGHPELLWFAQELFDKLIDPFEGD
jgi:hypothetical protein